MDDEDRAAAQEWGPGYRRYTVGRPPDDVGVVTLTVAYDHALAAVAELRAVLAPLLDEPWRTIANYGEPDERCVFCDETDPHAPDCPVLRRDALLGR